MTKGCKSHVPVVSLSHITFWRQYFPSRTISRLLLLTTIVPITKQLIKCLCFVFMLHFTCKFLCLSGKSFGMYGCTFLSQSSIAMLRIQENDHSNTRNQNAGVLHHLRNESYKNLKHCTGNAYFRSCIVVVPLRSIFSVGFLEISLVVLDYFLIVLLNK